MTDEESQAASAAEEKAIQRAKSKMDEQQEFGQQASQGHLHFGEPAYWEERYVEEFAKGFSNFDTFDFYCEFDEIYPMIDSIIDMTGQHQILLVGIGRSNTLEFLYNVGQRNITCIDVSPTVIMKMSQKYAHFHGVEFICMDCREMGAFPEKNFSLIIDKGCMDSIFCGTEFRNDTEKYFRQVYRILKDEATFLSISHAAPLTRVPYLRVIRWAVDTTKLPEGESLIMYILTRTEKEELLNRKVVGGEASLPGHKSNVVSKAEQSMNKNSTTKQPGGGGGLTVTGDPDDIANLVNDNLDDEDV
jgi:ubiquinone/menaquinone biosynthesis C-methylase UbiE